MYTSIRLRGVDVAVVSGHFGVQKDWQSVYFFFFFILRRMGKKKRKKETLDSPLLTHL